MYFKGADVQFCIDKAKEACEAYKMYVLSPNVSKSLDDLMWIMGEYLGKKVVLSRLDIPETPATIKATYCVTEDAYEIYLAPGLDPTMEKFVMCKELFHVILDTESCRSMDLVGLVEDMTVNLYLDKDEEVNSPATWEILAEIGAMEFLFPYAERRSLSDDELANGGAKALSDQYKIPLYLVEAYCSAHQMKMFGQFA